MIPLSTKVFSIIPWGNQLNIDLLISCRQISQEPLETLQLLGKWTWILISNKRLPKERTSSPDQMIPDHQTSQTVWNTEVLLGRCSFKFSYGSSSSHSYFLSAGLGVNPCQTPIQTQSATSTIMTKNVVKSVCSLSLSISQPSAVASWIHDKFKKVDRRRK